MKKNTLLKDFAKYASLNVLGMLGLSCYILADTFFVAKGLLANGLAALNIALPVYSFIHGCGLMFGMGGATKYSICRSQGKMEEANRTFTNTIMLACIFAMVFFLIGLVFSGKIAGILGADEAVFRMSKTYLQVILMFAPLFLLNNVILCFVRNDGAPSLSMIAMISGSLSNVVLDYVFIFPLKMGIFGAAFATGMAPIISLLILSVFFFKKRNHFRLIKCRFLGHLVKNIFSSGLPSLITEASSGIVIIIFNNIILQTHGNVGVAAYGIIANISFVVIALYTGIAQGIQPIMSSNYGTGKQKNVQSLLRYSMITMLVISGLVYTWVFFGAPQIVGLFNSDGNILLKDIAETGMRIYFLACVFVGFNIIMSVYFTSTDNVRPAHIVSILRGFVLIVPLAFLLSSFGGIIGVWCVFPVTELIVSCIGLALCRVRFIP